MAIVFTVALNRCVKGLQRLGIKRGLAILITLLTSLAIVILFFIIIVPPFIEQFQKLIELLPQAWDLVRNNSIQWRQQFQFDWLPSLPEFN
jgi:predicted PurR-regulated permease PerM